MKLTYLHILAYLLIFSNIQAQTVKEISSHPDFNPDLKPFYHGVASGDAKDDRVIIWTKITPDILLDSIIVKYYISADSNFIEDVFSGNFKTNLEINYTIKIDAVNLVPNTKYYYYFEALENKSIIGKTKTLPAKGSLNEELKIAVFSGSNYNAGYFNVYKSVANNPEVDAVFHLGDYIYEYATNGYGKHKNRALFPDKELISLDDYRKRYSHYRLDKDLMLAHQNLTWYVVWDDHETANN